MMTSSLWILSFALLAGGVREKPAAVKICFESSEIPLFKDRPARNYRSLGRSGHYVLDLEIRLNGQSPKYLTKAGSACVKAWMAAEPIRSLAVGFAKTDLNLRPLKRKIRLRLKPDLWYDGGTYKLVQAPFSRFSTNLPGEVKLYRQEGQDQEFLTKDFKRIPAGLYRVSYLSPLQTCQFKVTVKAEGTVRKDNNPKLFQKLAQAYRRDYAAEIAARNKTKCKEGETLELEVFLVDGVFRNPWKPKISKVYDPMLNKRYQLVKNGVSKPFVDGETLEIGYDQSIRLESAGGS